LLEVVTARQADALLAPPSRRCRSTTWLDAMLAWQAQPGTACCRLTIRYPAPARSWPRPCCCT
jgi:hypothetical protein